MNNCILHFQLDSIHLVYKDLYEHSKLFSTSIPDWNSAHHIHVKVLGSLLFHWQFPDKTSHVSTSCSWQNSTTVQWKISTNTINSLLSDLVNVLSYIFNLFHICYFYSTACFYQSRCIFDDQYIQVNKAPCSLFRQFTSATQLDSTITTCMSLSTSKIQALYVK